MKSTRKRLCIPIVAVSLLLGAGRAHADAVTAWNAIMQATVAAPPTNANFQARWGAIVQLAVFEAVNAATGDYEPYLGTIAAPPWASPDAAAIAAAHRTLVTTAVNMLALRKPFGLDNIGRLSPIVREESLAWMPSRWCRSL